MKYIDVSEWQGTVDWEAVKPHIDGAILRAGYGAGHADRQFARNAAECNRLGIPCGAYWFSYAGSAAKAKAEAEALLAAVKPWRMELPLCFDFEYDSVSVARSNGVPVSKALATAMVRAFCEAIEAGGYYALFYANPDFLSHYFDADLPKRFGLWLAQWPGGTPDVTKPPRQCAMWQWTSTGRVPGVTGNVDVSEAYTDFAAVIRAAGINRLGASEAPLEDARGAGAERLRGFETETTPPTSALRETAEATSPCTGEPFSAALRWAVDAGILPPDSDPADTPTLAAVAEMFCLCRRGCGKEDST